MSLQFGTSRNIPLVEKYNAIKGIGADKVRFDFISNNIQPKTDEDLDELVNEYFLGRLVVAKNNGYFQHGDLDITITSYCSLFVNGTCNVSKQKKNGCYWHNVKCDQYDSILPHREKKESRKFMHKF